MSNTVGAAKRTLLGTPDDGSPKILAGFIGGVAADEPRAALAARQVLATGGNAADAAVALGSMLAVTLPSRASLGAGGACMAYQPGANTPNRGVPEAVMFLPAAAASRGGDRPAAVPMLARGLYLLSARYGSQMFAEQVAPAEEVARFGAPVSRALARDLSVVAGPLMGDAGAAAIFAPGGAVLGEGGRLVQSDLGGTLGQIRTVGVGDMYQGLLAHTLVEASAQAGGPLSVNDLRLARAGLLPAIEIPAGPDQVAFLPLPADGGLASAAAFQVLQQDPAALQSAALRGLSAAAQFRAAGGSAAAILAQPGAQAALPGLPASTSFAVVDRHGGTVACALTMDNLFGTGRVAPGTGIVLAASPRAKALPLLSAAIAWNQNTHAFRAAVGASGQNAAGLAGAAAMTQALGIAAVQMVPEPGRSNVAACDRYLPGGDASCRFSADERGAGLAAGGN